jgi:hypothetical protein
LAGQEKSRQRIASPRERRLQIEPIHFRHLQISHHTTRRIGVALREKVARRRKRLHREPARPQHLQPGGPGVFRRGNIGFLVPASSCFAKRRETTRKLWQVIRLPNGV